MVGMLTPGADPVRKVSIIPRGMALGVTLSTPRTTASTHRARAAREDPCVARRAGGRGARVRRVDHRRGVGHPAGHPHRARDGRALGDEREGGLPLVALQDGPRACAARREPVSEATQELVDHEVRRSSNDERRPRAAPARDREKLDSLAEALERETLDEADAYAAAGIDRAASRVTYRPASSDPIDIALAEDLGCRRPHDAGGRARGRSGARRDRAAGARRDRGLAWRATVFEQADPRLVFVAPARRGLARGWIASRRSAARPRRSSPASAWRSTSSAGCPGWPPSRRATSRPSRAPARASSTRARPRPGLRELEKAAVRAGGGVSPQRAVRRDPREGEPRRAGGRRGGGHAARLSAAPAGVMGGGGVRDARRGRGGGGGRGAAHPARQHAPDELRRGGGRSRRARRARGLRAGSRSRACAAWPRRAWTTSASAR